MATQKQSIDKPAWVVYIRPIGAPNQPWEKHGISAQSAIQADAILRRMGYEMQTGTAHISPESWPELAPKSPLPLMCTNCGYSLDGLMLDGSRIVCPECDFGQVLVPWTPEHIHNAYTPFHIIRNLLAIIGLITAVLFAVVLFAAVM